MTATWPSTAHDAGTHDLGPVDSGGPMARRGEQGPLVLERYRLYRRLGTGAFGTVWLARDERLEREVAVKIIARERIAGGRFEREAKAAARLAHPGIVTLYEAAVDPEGAYLVSELVRGTTLQELLQAGRCSDNDIVEIAIALCDALSHAHAQGVVHRDVKPSNVLVPERSAARAHAQAAKLTDFGIARVIGDGSLTRTGDVIGTAAYMAPEQAQGRDAGAPADLYSLALVIYEALTGVNPAGIGNPTGAQRAQRLGAGAHLPPLRRQRRDLPRELGRGVDLALRPRPRERGSIEELRGELVAALGQVGDRPGVVSGPWRRANDATNPHGSQGRGPARVPADLSRPEAHPGTGVPRWLASAWSPRALAALAAAALTLWFAGNVLVAPPLPPTLGALLAAALVLVLPGAGWLVLVGSLATAAVLSGRPGAALVLVAGALPAVLLAPFTPTAWPLCAGAPALGMLGLAGAWPAVAARAAGATRRAGLGLIGWVWLALAGPLTGSDLYFARAPGTPPAGVWTASLGQAVHHVLEPLMSSGALAPAPVWALGALILPWLVRGRSLRLDAVLAGAWALGVVLATVIVLGAAHAVDSAQGVGAARSAVVGAVVSALLAVAPSAGAKWRITSQHRSARAGLA